MRTSPIRFDEHGKIKRSELEFNVVEHCNLTCVNCDHASPDLPKSFSDPDRFLAEAAALATVMRVDQIQLVGGEPLLHPQLIDFVDAARKSGLGKRVAIVTNGVLLHRADRSLFERIDKLSISLYPGVTKQPDLKPLEKLSQQLGFELEIRRPTEFRRTLLNQENEDKALVGDIYRRCAIVHEYSCHTLHDGKYYKCSPAPFLDKRLAVRGLAVGPRADGVTISGNPSLRDDLIRYLQDSNPLTACHWCLGTSGKREHHRLLRSQEEPGLNQNPHGLLETRSDRARRLVGKVISLASR